MVVGTPEDHEDCDGGEFGCVVAFEEKIAVGLEVVAEDLAEEEGDVD